jgi:hypothetical protein
MPLVVQVFRPTSTEMPVGRGSDLDRVVGLSLEDADRQVQQATTESYRFYLVSAVKSDVEGLLPSGIRQFYSIKMKIARGNVSTT